MARICRTAGLILCCVLPVAVPLSAQQNASAARTAQPSDSGSPFSLQIRPAFDIPVGTTAEYFSFGGTMDIDVRYALGGTPVYLAGGFSYAYAPDRAGDTVSIATARLGAGAELNLSPRLQFRAFAQGGYYYGTLNSFSVSSTNPYAGGGLEFAFRPNPRWSVGLSGTYRSYFGLYQGVSAGLGATIILGALPASAGTDFYPPSIQPLSGALSVDSFSVPPLFPVFYQYYDDHPIGRIEVTDTAGAPATNLSASVYIRQFMDNPKTVNIPGTLEPGQKISVDLYALFNDSVLTITEGSKVSAEVTLDCIVDGKKYRDTKVQTVQFLNRNAMTWDDNRRAAAFVTAKDPEVLSFAKNVTGPIQETAISAVNANLQTAVGLHDALDLFGLNYVSDPTTPYVVFSKKQDVADFLQFPRQTLQYKSGDCDDLSILYGALLEAVGVNAAFVTTPGHIFVAFDTGMTLPQATRSLVPPDRIIEYDGNAWIPVEITLRHRGFLSAWQEGAKEWQAAKHSGQAGFYPIEDAWKVYHPVGLPGSGQSLMLPDQRSILASYRADMSKYIDQNIHPQITRLEKEISATGSISGMNRLGILYAKYGKSNEAENEFRAILSRRSSYVPALINLGNVYYLRRDWKTAREFYREAITLDPKNADVLLAVARVDQELEDFNDAKRAYDRLTAVDPVLAKQYSFLAQGASDTNRASDTAAERRAVAWDEK